MPSTRSILAGAAVLTAVPMGPPAAASPLFELVGDTYGGGGLTARINGGGAASTYFNPALLVDASPGLDLGVFVVADEIGIQVDGRATSPLCDERRCDVPSVGSNGPSSFRHGSDNQPIEDPTLPTRWLQDGTDQLAARPRQVKGSGHNTRAYQSIGLVTRVFRERLVLGLSAMIPLGEFTTAKAFYNDEREQYFSNSLHPELYSDRLTATSLSFGGGMRLHRKIAVGATFTLSLANTAAAPVYVADISNLDTVLLDSDVGVKAAVAPHFGVVWDPLSRLRVAATVHTPQSFQIQTGFSYLIASGTEQATTLSFTHSYMPLTVATGGTYRLRIGEGRQAWLTGMITYARWSKYQDRHSENPTGEYRWSDTLTIAAGARGSVGKIRGWLDLQYQPSPVPPQTGRSNYVDNDRAGVSTGADYEFSLWGSRFRAGANLLGHRLFYRHVTKFTAPDGASSDDYPHLVRDEIPSDTIDAFGAPVPNRDGLQTNNPGFPGFASKGWVVGGGLHLAVQY